MDDTFVTALPDLGAIEVTGEDAEAFLHAQFTSDIHQIGDKGSRFSAWCDPKGRVIATFLIGKIPAGYLLLLHRDLVEKISRRLQMYVLRSRVRVLQFDGTCTGIRANRPAVGPTGSYRINFPGDNSRYIIAGPVDPVVTENLEQAEDSQWQLLDIAAGIPWISPPTSGLALPQELNLEAIGGLSHHKGCYPGQEIIARLHFRGQVKKRLHRGTVDAASANPCPGSILSPADGSHSSGIVINTARVRDNGWRLLAAVNVEDAAAGALYLEHGEAVTLEPLPA